MGYDGPSHQVGALDIRVHNLAPVFIRGVGQLIFFWVYSGAVEEMVDATEVSDDGSDRFCRVGRRRHIEFVDSTSIFIDIEGLQGFGVDIAQC